MIMTMLSRLMGTKEQELEIPGLPRDFAKVVARIQGREPSNDDRLCLAAGQDAASVMEISTAISAKPPEPKKPILEIGQLVEGKGVYVGEWKPKDRDGRDPGKVFDVYAAPEDVVDNRGKKLLLTFNNAVKHVAGLRDWHGHDGARFENDTALYNAIRDGRHEELEKWFIPTLDLVNGYDKNMDKVNGNNLYEHKDKGAFRGTFTERKSSDIGQWYWSCTECRNDPPDLVQGVNFIDGGGGWLRKNTSEIYVRPVRAELRL